MEQALELEGLEKVIQRYMLTNASDRELQRAITTLSRLREELAKLQEEAQKLKEAPLQYGIYLGPSPHDERDILVGLGNVRFEARLAADLKAQLNGLALGQQVLLNNDHNVVALRGEYVRGETAEVINVLKPQGSGEIISLIEETGAPLRARAKWREGKEIEVACSRELEQVGVRRGDIVLIDADQMLATTKVRPRLHVRASGSEGTVVEISDRLFEEGVYIGDLVRIEAGLKFAFEKLPSFETGELTLEEVPDVSYADIGGLDAQIEAFRDAIELPYLQRSRFERYQLSRPKGILLYGPPGCGKTMVAKAVANSLTESIRDHLSNLEKRIRLYTELRSKPLNDELLKNCRALLGVEDEHDDASALAEAALKHLEESLSAQDVDLNLLDEKLSEIRSVLDNEEGVRSYFLNVKGPELLDKYVGETEHRIRSIFEEARRHASYYTPVIIFFDEMEAMFRARGSGRSSDIETTIVPQFLSEIDGVENSANVLLIGATNRDDMIDPAILRPGRLDVKIKIDRPTQTATADIFSLYLQPTLPLSSDGHDLRPAQNASGNLIFRTAYARLDGELQELTELLPPGCDLRLALSISQREVDELSILTPRISAQQACLQELRENSQMDLQKKLSRFKSNLQVSLIVEKLRALSKRCAADTQFAGRLQFLAQKEWLAEAMIQQAVALLFSPSSVIKVLTKGGQHYTFPVSDFINGAVIASIVSRAKRSAVKREMDGLQKSEGISSEDLRAGIVNELSESQEQLALYKLRNEMDVAGVMIQKVDLHLEAGGADPWSEDKQRPYRIIV